MKEEHDWSIPVHIARFGPVNNNNNNDWSTALGSPRVKCRGLACWHTASMNDVVKYPLPSVIADQICGWSRSKQWMVSTIDISAHNSPLMFCFAHVLLSICCLGCVAGIINDYLHVCAKTTKTRRRTYQAAYPGKKVDIARVFFTIINLRYLHHGVFIKITQENQNMNISMYVQQKQTNPIKTNSSGYM